MFTLFITTTHNIYISGFTAIGYIASTLLSGAFVPLPCLKCYRVISSRLPSLIRLGTLTLWATTTKHARRVCPPTSSDRYQIVSQSISLQTRQSGEHSDAPVRGHRQPGHFWPRPTCDCCFKELFDSLTSLPDTFSLLHPFIPPLLFSFLSRPD